MRLRINEVFRVVGLWAFFLVQSSVPACAQFRTIFDMRIAMRDGVELSADVWLPFESKPYPVILMRTPYMKNWSLPALNFGKLGAYYASHGYVLVVQDVRGRGDSGGAFDFFFQEGKDGYDTIEWIARQRWSNGRVGMMGGSYLGTVQWLAARENPPHLVCMVPRASAGRYFDEIPYQGGAFALDWALMWLNDTSGRTEQRANLEGMNLAELFKERPLLTLDEKLGRRIRLYREFLDHDTMDAYWKRIQFVEADFQKIKIPTLTVTGWFDDDQPGSLFYWRNIRKESPERKSQYLLLGPWTHPQTGIGGTEKLGEFSFSRDAVYDSKGLHLAFFDHFLKQSSPEFAFPHARVYLTGSNHWVELEEYPPTNVESRPLYLHSGGSANTSGGDGRLSWNQPGEEKPDEYAYSPSDPVPSDVDDGPGTDQSRLEQRKDVLVYSSDVIERPLTILGKVTLALSASSSAYDTDFTARLLDVQPTGHVLALGPVRAVIRARYRAGYDRMVLLTPGKIEHYTIELFDIGHTFLPGHRIRLDISSSYAPAFNPNSNTGRAVATDTQSVSASQRIFHNGADSSFVSLPVLPEKN